MAKVGKKVFVFFGSATRPLAVGVKLPRSAPSRLPAVRRASGYGLGRHGWVTVHLDGPDAPEDDLVRDWIVESYCTIAPKKLAGLLVAEAEPLGSSARCREHRTSLRVPPPPRR